MGTLPRTRFARVPHIFTFHPRANAMATMEGTSRKPAFNPFQFDRVSTAPFILKLYSLVDDPKCSAVTWTADGRAFVVHDRVTFERRYLIGLLADFPHKCTFGSFVRELNSYGFRFVANRDEATHSMPSPSTGSSAGTSTRWGGLRRKANYGRFRRNNNRFKTVSRLR